MVAVLLRSASNAVVPGPRVYEPKQFALLVFADEVGDVSDTFWEFSSALAVPPGRCDLLICFLPFRWSWGFPVSGSLVLPFLRDLGFPLSRRGGGASGFPVALLLVWDSSGLGFLIASGLRWSLVVNWC